MKEHYCDFCGKDTIGVDYDYLIGHNHLACVLADMPELKDLVKEASKKKKPVEIKNWTKLNGQKFDVMGASFVIMDTFIDTLSSGNTYTAWIHPWNDSEALVRVTLFADNMDLQLKVLPPAEYDYTLVPIDLTTTITKTHVSNPSIFVQTIAEGLIDDPSVRDIISFIGRKQDNTTRFKGRGMTKLTGSNGSSGNNLW